MYTQLSSYWLQRVVTMLVGVFLNLWYRSLFLILKICPFFLLLFFLLFFAIFFFLHILIQLSPLHFHMYISDVFARVNYFSCASKAFHFVYTSMISSTENWSASASSRHYLFAWEMIQLFHTSVISSCHWRTFYRLPGIKIAALAVHGVFMTFKHQS